jgi:hypothetical protein
MVMADRSRGGGRLDTMVFHFGRGMGGMVKGIRVEKSGQGSETP